MTVRPARSITRVCGPLSASISAVVPTLTMRSPLMASAWAMVKRSSTVTILPLTSSMSGVCARTGMADTTKEKKAIATASLNKGRMLNPPGDVRVVGGDLGALRTTDGSDVSPAPCPVS